jgi:hypothetical protein
MTHSRVVTKRPNTEVAAIPIDNARATVGETTIQRHANVPDRRTARAGFSRAKLLGNEMKFAPAGPAVASGGVGDHLGV